MAPRLVTDACVAIPKSHAQMGSLAQNSGVSAREQAAVVAMAAIAVESDERQWFWGHALSGETPVQTRGQRGAHGKRSGRPVGWSERPPWKEPDEPLDRRPVVRVGEQAARQ